MDQDSAEESAAWDAAEAIERARVASLPRVPRRELIAGIALALVKEHC